MAKEFLTDEQVKAEVEKLKESPAVKLAQKECALKIRHRKYLYQLRWYEKRGKELMASGINEEDLERMYKRSEEVLVDGQE